MFPSKQNSSRSSADGSRPKADSEEPIAAEIVHRACWYGRRTNDLPSDIGCHTIENGELLYCAHPMWFPVVGRQFDVRNCEGCDYFRPRQR
jgi:hypothetical protein